MSSRPGTRQANPTTVSDRPKTNELLALGVDLADAIRTYSSGFQEAKSDFGFGVELGQEFRRQ